MPVAGDQYKVLSFDCYGTLIDWETGIIRATKELLSVSGLSLSDDAILRQFAEIETVVQSASPTASYAQVLTEVGRRIAEQNKQVVPEALFGAFADSVKDWPAFPDSSAALNQLSQRYKLVILSNIDDASFALSNANHLHAEFFRIFTAEQIGSYKPDVANFHYLLARLEEQGIQRSEILHVAQSLYHDIRPAQMLGLDHVWINRRKGKSGGGATPALDEAIEVDHEFGSMEAFAGWVM